MRLLTRDDFDGLACAALLSEKGVVDSYYFVHPREIQAGNIAVAETDVLANVPYTQGCGLWFSHHTNEDDPKHMKIRFEGDARPAPSTTQVIWDYYGGTDTFGERFLPLLEAVNMISTADLTWEEILMAEGWIIIAFIIDPRTGLAQMDDFSISNEQFYMNMIDYCRTRPIEEIIQIPDVRERVDRYNEQQILFKDMLRQCSEDHRNVVVTNLLNEDIIYCGNRFVIYASHPDQNIEIRLEWDKNRENVIFSCGHSILNRTSKTDVGKLMARYDGGGHEKAGSCRVPADKWEAVLEELLEQMKKDG